MSQRILKVILVLAVIGTFGYVFIGPVSGEWALLYNKYFPCQSPIVYNLGTFDTRFGISRADFLQALADAEAIWEKPIGRNLFQYQSDAIDSSVKVNLVYDYRQAATLKINNISSSVSGTRASYDALKAKYELLQKSYLTNKSAYDLRVADFKTKQDAYTKEVNYWNARGGAPEAEYNKLQAENAALKTEFGEIQKMQEALNAQVAELNALVETINNLAHTLNINVSELNTINQNRGEEFTEGEYKVDATGREINIYEFSTKTKLQVVLAHELGHALGLDHVADPKAIMYKMNDNTTGLPTADDIAALKAVCRIK